MPASPWQRLAAFGIDLLLVLLILALIEIAEHVLHHGPGPEPLISAELLNPYVPIGIVLALLVSVVLCWRLLQGTPGILLMGLRLVDARDGSAPGIGQALLRLLAYIPAAGLFLIGILWMFWDPRHRGWQDLLSHTRLIQDDDGRKNLAQLLKEAGA